MADLTTGNINTEAQTAASVNDGDYIYIYKADAGVFSKIEKSLLLQGAGGGSGSGISAEVYEAIKDNVNRVQGRLDALIGALANMSFNSLPKPALVGELTWPDGTTPTPSQTPSLAIKYNGATVSSVNVTADTSGTTAISFVVKASNLTSSNTFELTLGGTGAGDCTLSDSRITAAQATNGATVTVSYSGTSAAYATLSVSGNGLTASVGIAISAAGSGLYTVIGTLTNCYIDASTSVNTQVPSGGTWSGTIVAESGYELPTINSSIITSGTVGGVSLSGSTLTISNITSDITFSIVATAAQQVTGYVTDGLVLHLDGKNQGSTPGSWIDTIGLKEFVLIGNPTVTADGVSFSTDGERQYGLYTGSVEDWPVGSCTIEVCFKPTIDFDEEGADAVSLFGNSNNKCMAATFVPGDNRGFGFAAIAMSETGTRNYKRLLSSNTTISSEQAVTLSMNFRRQMLNGVLDTSDRVNTRVGTLLVDAGLSVGGHLRQNNSTVNPTSFIGCDAIIHEVRIYNRLLDESDMRDNQKCDNYRYNLGLNI